MFLAFVVYLFFMILEFKEFLFNGFSFIMMGYAVTLVGCLISCAAVGSGENLEELYKFSKLHIEKVVYIPLVLILASTLTPTERQAKFIVGAYIVSEAYQGVTSIEGIEKLPPKIVKMLDGMMNELIAEFDADVVVDSVTQVIEDSSTTK